MVTKHNSKQQQAPLTIRLQDRTVPERTHVKVIELTLESNAKATRTIHNLLDQGGGPPAKRGPLPERSAHHLQYTLPFTTETPTDPNTSS